MAKVKIVYAVNRECRTNVDIRVIKGEKNLNTATIFRKYSILFSGLNCYRHDRRFAIERLVSPLVLLLPLKCPFYFGPLL